MRQSVEAKAVRGGFLPGIVHFRFHVLIQPDKKITDLSGIQFHDMQMGQPTLPGVGEVFHDLPAEPGFLQQAQHEFHIENRFDGEYFSGVFAHVGPG